MNVLLSSKDIHHTPVQDGDISKGRNMPLMSSNDGLDFAYDGTMLAYSMPSEIFFHGYNQKPSEVINFVARKFHRAYNCFLGTLESE